jgi:hypothetical protein
MSVDVLSVKHPPLATTLTRLLSSPYRLFVAVVNKYTVIYLVQLPRLDKRTTTFSSSRFSKHATATAIPGKEATDVAPAVLLHFYTFGKPKILLIDGGWNSETHFSSRSWRPWASDTTSRLPIIHNAKPRSRYGTRP